MNAAIAHALRRAALIGGALGATLAGHALTTPGVGLLPIAPVLWLALVAAVVPLGARRRPGTFTAWGAAGTLGALLAAQAVLHLAMWQAPWAFGLVEHHTAPPVTWSALGAHLALAVLLAVPLVAGQRVLAAILRVARALLAPARRPALPRAAWRIGDAPATPITGGARRPRTSRGPPARPLPPAGPLTA